MTDEEIRERLQQLQPIIGDAARALWIQYTSARTIDKRESIRRRIQMISQGMLDTFQDKILLPPPEPEQTFGDIKIGKVIYNGKELQEFSIKKQDLIRHAAVFGKSGSGKTNTAFHIIKELLDNKIPFLVCDWKRNFRDLLRIPEFRGRIKFYTVGRDILPFYFNPKIPPKGSDEEVYQKKLLAVIEWAYFLGFGADDILMEVYDKGNFAEMKEWLVKQRKRGREMLWWASAKRTLNSINFGGLGRMVNHPRPFNIKKLLKQNIVLELDGLSEAEKCFVIGSLINWIQEFRRAQPDREILKHAFVVEEAHHIFRKKPETRPEDITDQMFREVREFGQAIIIFDQHPHKTSTQALGNTNTRIAMQIDLERDRKALAGCMLLKRDQEEWLGKQKVGEAIVKTGNTETPFQVRIPRFEIKKGTVTDHDLKRIFKTKTIQTPPTPEVVEKE